MDGSWIKLHRSIVDTAFWPDDWLVRLWIWCLVKAKFDDSKWKHIHLKRGEFVTGRHSAAEELGVSPSKWMRGIHKLSEYGCIEYKPDSKWTVISICNYSTYQDDNRPARTDSGHLADSQRTLGGQLADTVEERKNLRREELLTPTHTPSRGAWMDHELVKDSPALQDAIRFWCATFATTHGHGRDDDDIRIDMRLAEALSKGWDAAQIAKSIRFSVTKLAKSWLDPDADFEQLAKDRASGARRPRAEIPITERC